MNKRKEKKEKKENVHWINLNTVTENFLFLVFTNRVPRKLCLYEYVNTNGHVYVCEQN